MMITRISVMQCFKQVSWEQNRVNPHQADLRQIIVSTPLCMTPNTIHQLNAISTNVTDTLLFAVIYDEGSIVCLPHDRDCLLCGFNKCQWTRQWELHLAWFSVSFFASTSMIQRNGIGIDSRHEFALQYFPLHKATRTMKSNLRAECSWPGLK